MASDRWEKAVQGSRRWGLGCSPSYVSIWDTCTGQDNAQSALESGFDKEVPFLTTQS